MYTVVLYWTVAHVKQSNAAQRNEKSRRQAAAAAAYRVVHTGAINSNARIIVSTRNASLRHWSRTQWLKREEVVNTINLILIMRRPRGSEMLLLLSDKEFMH